MDSFTGILKNKKEINDQVLISQYLLDHNLVFKPGQFIAIEIEDTKRFYSIASAPNNNKSLELISAIDTQGVGRTFFQHIKIGDKINFLGPEGKFILRKTSKPKIFLATDVGISPIRSMLQHLSNQNFSNPIYLFWGMRFERDIFLKDELETIRQKLPHFHYYYSLSRETTEQHLKGYVQYNLDYLLRTQKLNPQDFEYYVCGGVETVRKIVTYLEEILKIQPQTISFEKFS